MVSIFSLILFTARYWSKPMLSPRLLLTSCRSDVLHQTLLTQLRIYSISMILYTICLIFVLTGTLSLHTFSDSYIINTKSNVVRIWIERSLICSHSQQLCGKIIITKKLIIKFPLHFPFQIFFWSFVLDLDSLIDIRILTQLHNTHAHNHSQQKENQLKKDYHNYCIMWHTHKESPSWKWWR
jgi:hypothetical protein